MRRPGAGLLLAALAAACGPEIRPPPRPDVLLLVGDTLRVDRTSVLHPGPQVTPALRALSARGTTFVQAVSPSSWTLPAMAAVFSGLDATGNRHAARAEAASLAERFAAAGYETLALSANPLLTADNGFARGFRSHVAAPAASVADLRADLGELRAWDAGALVARALREAAAVPRERPLFVWLQFMDTHVPYDPANEALAAPEPGWSAARPAAPRWDAWIEDPDADQARLLGGWRRAYDGQVAFLDAALGRLLAHWPQVRAGEPLVAVTSDHGEGLFDHARDAGSPAGPGPLGAAYGDHGEQLHEEALRVPLVLAGPGVPAGRREPRAVTTRDLGATLLQLAGLPAPGPRLPLAADDAVPGTLFGAGTRGRYARRGDRVLIQPYPGLAGGPARLLAVEPERLALRGADLAGDEPLRLEALQAELQAWLEAAGEEAPPLDPATRARLEALGYLR